VNNNIYKNTTEYLIKYLTKINEESNNPTFNDLANYIDTIDFLNKNKKPTTNTKGNINTNNNINNPDPNEFKAMIYNESDYKSNGKSDNGTFNEKLKKLLPTNIINKNNTPNKISNLMTLQFPTNGGSINSDDFTFLTEDISETEDFGF
jgi:hypothetical protein